MNWDDAYLRRDTPWDKGAAAPELEYLVKSRAFHGRVLVPGCGMGHDVRAIATGDVDEVVGLDISETAIRLAKARTDDARARFEVGDLFDSPEWMRGYFDCVWEHTCFCAIDPALRNQYVDSIADMLLPGGKLVAIFYLNPRDEDTAGPPYGVSREALDQLFSLRFRLDAEWSPRACYTGREGREWCRVFEAIV